MSGICSQHKNFNKDCKLCSASVSELLGVSEDVLADKLKFAESEGEIACGHCGFKMYKATTKTKDGKNRCPLCDKDF